jgi:hypothetical protein
LIRRFIDPKARFAFAPEDQVPNGAVPYDMFHAEGFGHRGEDCTFETLRKDFRIREPKVKTIRKSFTMRIYPTKSSAARKASTSTKC